MARALVRGGAEEQRRFFSAILKEIAAAAFNTHAVEIKQRAGADENDVRWYIHF